MSQVIVVPHSAPLPCPLWHPLIHSVQCFRVPVCVWACERHPLALLCVMGGHWTKSRVLDPRLGIYFRLVMRSSSLAPPLLTSLCQPALSAETHACLPGRHPHACPPRWTSLANWEPRPEWLNSHKEMVNHWREREGRFRNVYVWTMLWLRRYSHTHCLLGHNGLSLNPSSSSVET